MIGLWRAEKKETRFMVDKAVIDTSVTLKWQFKDELETEQAIHILEDLIGGKIELISPAFFVYEIVNVIYIAVIKNWIPKMNNIIFLIINSARYDSFINPVRKGMALDRALYMKNLNCYIIADVKVRLSNGVKAKIQNIGKLGVIEKRYSYASLPSPSHYVYLIGIMLFAERTYK
ncbi:MAG: type II toxin-antitoxin system VapC family toxin [bacterium]